MSSLALALVLASAVAHATWNLLTKRVEAGASFIWLFDLVSVLVYAPMVAMAIELRGMPVRAAAFGLILISSLLHLGYFVLLTRGYRAGDLSLVYPLARGTGPLLATIAAIVVLGERPGPLGLAGALLVVGGAVVLSGDPTRLRQTGAGRAVGYALLTGGFIAAYTLVDKEGVSAVLVPPVAYTWGISLGSCLLLTPHAGRHRQEVLRLWRSHRRATIAVGVLSPLAYILVLSALVFSPISSIAPTREIGVLFGTVMGSRLLGEGDAGRRLAAAGAMVLGVALLALR